MQITAQVGLVQQRVIARLDRAIQYPLVGGYSIARIKLGDDSTKTIETDQYR